MNLKNLCEKRVPDLSASGMVLGGDLLVSLEVAEASCRCVRRSEGRPKRVRDTAGGCPCHGKGLDFILDVKEVIR